MTKINLQDVANLNNQQSAVSEINRNSALIESKSDTFLSRTGTAPNFMLADLDMNSHRILNLPSPQASTEPLRKRDLTDFVGGTLSLNTNTEFYESRSLAAADTISGAVTYIR